MSDRIELTPERVAEAMRREPIAGYTPGPLIAFPNGPNVDSDGEWSIDTNYDVSPSLDPDQMQEPLCLATIERCEWAIGMPEVEANAGLYAAAPDLQADNQTLVALCRRLAGTLEGVLREAVILSEDYLSAFDGWSPDAVIQGWEKARWLRAIAARKTADAALALMPPKENDGG